MKLKIFFLSTIFLGVALRTLKPVRKSGFPALCSIFKVLNSIPDRNTIPLSISVMTSGCSCLNIQTIIVMATISMNIPNCPDVKPKNLIGLFIFLMVLMAQIIRKATIITTTAMIHPNRYSLACGLFVARE